MTVALWKQAASTQRPLSATDRQTSYQERVWRSCLGPKVHILRRYRSDRCCYRGRVLETEVAFTLVTRKVQHESRHQQTFDMGRRVMPLITMLPQEIQNRNG